MAKKTEPGKNDLATRFPVLMNEWAWDKNDIDPTTIPPTYLKSVWWRCQLGHEWTNSPRNRTADNGHDTSCPYCSGRKTWPGFNDLPTKCPDIMKEWNWDKNEISPEGLSASSSVQAWWKCKNGHEWKARIDSRTRMKDTCGCPYCAGERVISGENDIASLYPELLEEWDFDKNTISPDQVMPGTDKKVWWVCSNGHSYEATPDHRIRDHTGCPHCQTYRSSSLAEQAIFYYLQNNLADEDVYNWATIRYEDKEWEADVFIPSRKLVIEYDGCFYHSSEERREFDIQKDKALMSAGYAVWHVQEASECNYIDHEHRFIYHTGNRINNTTLLFVLTFILNDLCNLPLLDVPDLQRDYSRILSSYRHRREEHSLEHLFPNIAAEWHPTKNGELTPVNFSYGSGISVWWLCPQGHEYQAVIQHRTRSHSGCPYCANQKVLRGYNDLESVYPKAAARWHTVLNGDIKPDSVYCRTKKKFWWFDDDGTAIQRTVSAFVQRKAFQ